MTDRTVRTGVGQSTLAERGWPTLARGGTVIRPIGGLPHSFVLPHVSSFFEPCASSCSCRRLDQTLKIVIDNATESVFFHRFAVSFVEWFARGVTIFPFLAFSLYSFVYPLFSIIQLTEINSVVLSYNIIGVLAVIPVTRESQYGFNPDTFVTRNVFLVLP